MKFSAASFLLVLSSAHTCAAWSPQPQQASSRRALLQQSLVGGASLLLVGTPPASASLLDEYGGAGTLKIEQAPAKVEKKAAATIQAKSESNMEPNLRSNYYYPTNKKRYLPRIKKCNDAIPGAAEAIGTEQWEQVEEFCAKVADDTILPMRLYTSSLLGGGTNVKVAFAKDMKKATDDFEKAQKKLTKAVAKKDRESSSAALELLASSLQSYREAGRLTGPDGGGDIPSVDDIRRSACRVQGRRFEEQTIKARDARLKEATSTVAVSSK